MSGLLASGRRGINSSLESTEKEFRLLFEMRTSRVKYMASLFSDTEPESVLSTHLARRGFGVTDMRDIIYGHLAVAGLHDPSAIVCFNVSVPEVDYDKSVANVFADATAYIIDSTESCQVLFYTDFIGSSRINDLPSWVPDWSVKFSELLPVLKPWHRVNQNSNLPRNISLIRTRWVSFGTLLFCLLSNEGRGYQTY